ncbi:MAG: NTP transferase domain-containing protein [Candidatus Nitronauta litoralis]|uniref:NTP transferase domain-containing protein n=1 Tax=Candidatus Nitronauta litoralis TaxID=2705533 RepID=A0A7T0FYQ8_9BACT|nr:MAG: NTP transferase domain-containing protein [Candidatus Nitronauta litoralis]
MRDQNLAVVILAAGKGTRMKSGLAKVLHLLDGKPLLEHVLNQVSSLEPMRVILVVGYQAEEVKREINSPDIEYVLQEEQLGTGHAVMQSEKALAGFEGDVLVLCGDMPLIKPDTLKFLLEAHREKQTACTFLSLKAEENKDFGRVIRDDAGNVLKIVEHRDATAMEKTVDEYNSGVYCFQKGLLFKALTDIKPENVQGEFYLTDTVQMLLKSGHLVQAIPKKDANEILGINSIDDLNRAEQLLSENF